MEDEIDETSLLVIASEASRNQVDSKKNTSEDCEAKKLKLKNYRKA